MEWPNNVRRIETHSKSKAAGRKAQLKRKFRKDEQTEEKD